jgi:50S ribosomal protein L16 3-hydroxylase
LKILARFEPCHDWLLEPGDLLYLPPGWGHDGTADGGDCMTVSIGFRAPNEGELARELLQRLADGVDTDAGRRYADPRQPPAANPARVPETLHAFAARALEHALAQPRALGRALGETLSEPKPRVWFDPGAPLPPGCGVTLDRRTRMMYDDAHVFVNGESFRAGGRDAPLMRRLADGRALGPADAARLSRGARALLDEWAQAGWLHPA